MTPNNCLETAMHKYKLMHGPDALRKLLEAEVAKLRHHRVTTAALKRARNNTQWPDCRAFILHNARTKRTAGYHD